MLIFSRTSKIPSAQKLYFIKQYCIMTLPEMSKVKQPPQSPPGPGEIVIYIYLLILPLQNFKIASVHKQFAQMKKPLLLQGLQTYSLESKQGTAAKIRNDCFI